MSVFSRVGMMSGLMSAGEGIAAKGIQLGRLYGGLGTTGAGMAGKSAWKSVGDWGASWGGEMGTGIARGAAIGGAAGAVGGGLSDNSTMLEGAFKGAIFGAVAMGVGAKLTGSNFSQIKGTAKRAYSSLKGVGSKAATAGTKAANQAKGKWARRNATTGPWQGPLQPMQGPLRETRMGAAGRAAKSFGRAAFTRPLGAVGGAFKSVGGAAGRGGTSAALMGPGLAANAGRGAARIARATAGKARKGARMAGNQALNSIRGLRKNANLGNRGAKAGPGIGAAEMTRRRNAFVAGRR